MRVVGAVAVALAVAATSCGQRPEDTAGPATFPDVIAVIGSDSISGEELSAFLAEVERSYAARNLAFPAVNTAEYSNLLAQAIEFLVRQARDEQAAAELGVVVSAAEVDEKIAAAVQVSGENLDRELSEAAVAPERVRAAVRAKLLAHKTFLAVVADIGPLLPVAGDGREWERRRDEQRRLMQAWENEMEARFDAATSYAAGFDPAELRTELSYEPPPGPAVQGACDLEDGEYTYEELYARGCAGDFPIPGQDGPACPVDLIEVPFFGGGFSSEEVDSGYSDYLADTSGVCVPDPRETIVVVGIDTGRMFEP